MVQMLLGCAVWGAVVRVTVRALFCKIDRVLLGMQFGVLVQVLFLGVLVTVRAHFYKIGGRVQGGAVWGCSLVRFGVMQVLFWGVASLQD